MRMFANLIVLNTFLFANILSSHEPHGMKECLLTDHGSPLYRSYCVIRLKLIDILMVAVVMGIKCQKCFVDTFINTYYE